MATLTWTIPKGGYAGTSIRAAAAALEQIAGEFPDANPTGASVTIQFNDSPATGTLGISVTGGPYTATSKIVG